MRKLACIFISLLLVSCEGDPEPFTPSEKIVSLEIISPTDVSTIENGDTVEIKVNLEVNISNEEQAEIIFFEDKGDITYNSLPVASGEIVTLNTTSDIILNYIPKQATDPTLIDVDHTIEVIMKGCEDSPNIRPNCSADVIRFETQN